MDPADQLALLSIGGVDQGEGNSDAQVQSLKIIFVYAEIMKLQTNFILEQILDLSERKLAVSFLSDSMSTNSSFLTSLFLL
jgi:hypothetical protein